MAKILFKPSDIMVNAQPNSKILAAARDNNVEIKSGCGAGRCGICIVNAEGEGLSDMTESEKSILTQKDLALDGTVRLACQARSMDSDVTIDVSIQDK